MTGSDDWGVKSSGYVRPTYDEALAVVQADFRLLFGNDVDLSSNSIFGQEAQAIARMYMVMLTEGEAVYDSRYVGSATGISLDRLAEIKQANRNPATYASGYLVFTPSVRILRRRTIPQGTTVATVDRTIQFVTTEDGYIESGAVQSGHVPARSKLPGRAYNLAAGSLVAISTPVSGVREVSQPEAMTGGSDAESDAAFRSRIRTYTPSAQATLAAYETALLDIDGVTGMSLNEDTNNGAVSIYIVGGDSAEIAAAIENVRAAGIAVTWARPTNAPINVTATASGHAPEIAAAISTFLNGLDVGEDVSYSSLVAAAVSGAAGSSLRYMSASGASQTASALSEKIIIPYSSLAVAGTITVTVST